MTNVVQTSRRAVLLGLPLAGLTACSSTGAGDILNGVLGAMGTGGGLSSADAAAGIRAALDNGVASAITQVGQSGGYLSDPTIRIPLPGQLADIQSSLSRFGLSGMLDELQVNLNRGAEAAAPLARDIFVDAIKAMSITDAIAIVQGSNTAATEYFQEKTTPTLLSMFTPIMTSALQQSGAIATFDDLTARLSSIPLAPQLGADAKASLIDFGVEKGLDGMFHYIAQEEAAIRENPAKRTSEILQRVFG